jgi:hypothetical protein
MIEQYISTADLVFIGLIFAFTAFYLTLETVNQYLRKESFNDSIELAVRRIVFDDRRNNT